LLISCSFAETRGIMPIPFLASIYFDGWPSWLPAPTVLLKAGITLGSLTLLKRWTSGATNTADRDMHGRVVMLTGGTSGIGAAVAFELAQRGAQVILLTQSPATDAFLADYVEDLRARTNNQLIYAEQLDMASLHSVRKFATKWIDNAPPRRLDMIISCAATLTPAGMKRAAIEDVDSTLMINYLANFHLLGILSPAIRAQPIDRDVRIIMTTCSSYISSPSLEDPKTLVEAKAWSPAKAYSRSKLALMTFGKSFQKHLDAYKRPDDLPPNAKVIFVDPGLTRTPGTRRWLTRGTILGLFLYLVLYFFSWLFLKSSTQGAQSILFAAMEPALGRGEGGKLIKECMEVDFARKDVSDEKVARKLWEWSDKLVETVEKAQAMKRARQKLEDEAKEKEKLEQEKAREIDSLVSAIKKGKEREAKQEAEKGASARKRKA
jgi:NAD(P)-dependent dehydrogenase (short-subunit alcohol dehydrogenase family)